MSLLSCIPSKCFFRLGQVIDTTEGADGREKRISLSMKLVEQSTGKDLDPSNAEADVSGAFTYDTAKHLTHLTSTHLGFDWLSGVFTYFILSRGHLRVRGPLHNHGVWEECRATVNRVCAKRRTLTALCLGG